MMRRGAVWGLMLASCLATGCRCCCLLNPYANDIDDISDTHVYFDQWYSPRLDVSRAGRPDWCGPFNSRIGKEICYLGCYDRYDDCNWYPPSHPYMYPGSSLAGPGMLPPPSATPTEIPPPPKPGEFN